MDKMGKGFEQLLGRKFRQAKSSIQAAWSAQPERESASNEVFECEKALRELNEWHERVIVPLNKTIKTLDEAVITSAGWALKISPVPESIKSRIESIKRAYATDTKSKVVSLIDEWESDRKQLKNGSSLEKKKRAERDSLRKYCEAYSDGQIDPKKTNELADITKEVTKLQEKLKTKALTLVDNLRLITTTESILFRLYQRYLIGLGSLYEDIANGSEAHASTLSSHLTNLAERIQGSADSLDSRDQNGEVKRSLLAESEKSEEVHEEPPVKPDLKQKEAKEEEAETASKPSKSTESDTTVEKKPEAPKVHPMGLQSMIKALSIREKLTQNSSGFYSGDEVKQALEEAYMLDTKSMRLAWDLSSSRGNGTIGQTEIIRLVYLLELVANGLPMPNYLPPDSQIFKTIL